MWKAARLNLMLAVLLPSFASAVQAPASHPVTPQWTEQYLKRSHSALLVDSDDDHVMSYYFFGTERDVTLMGLERVRGEDYEQFFSLMLFSGQRLLGYYQNVLSFPSGVEADGTVQFPRGVRSWMGKDEAEGKAGRFNILNAPAQALCQEVGPQVRCADWVPVTP
ncbi:hypothetical protein ACQUQU_07465 [Thalassolituus sp. LLYu03]|uniref:hypothetical protein n=1 Tax=Thalassolituus sp. LLYu03 TaxID=3421656 RepID=UPI003D2B0CC6